MSQPPEFSAANPANNVRLVYILYLVGIVFGVTGIIGVVIAYVNRSDAPDWLKSHYDFQIRTFWIGALYLFFGVLLALVLIGYLILLFWVIWLCIRCVKGLKYIDQKQPYPDAHTWMF
ncbi:MAG: membrane protein [Wenzhouxiangellaceae bacterium]